jgi:cytochrome c oxidase cbb3-type subunit 4
MISGIVTSFLLVLFVAAWAWAWSPNRKAEFDAAARLALEDSVEVTEEHRQ